MKRLITILLVLLMFISLGSAVLASGEPSSREPVASVETASGESAASVEPSSEEPATSGELPQGRSCGHVYGYRIQADSYEATDTKGGYRHYVCKDCGAEYAYRTDPLVYSDGFVKQDGSIVEVNETNEGSVNPNLPLWEHIPDGEPHVFWSKADLEWRVYIYGSHDNAGICGDDHVLWSAPVYDLSDWRYDGEIIRIEADPFDPSSAKDNPSAEMEEASAETEETSSEAASREAGSAEAGGSDGGMRAGALFAPDCDYDRLTDTFVLITFENGKRCAMYRSYSPAGRFDEEEPVFCFITGFENSGPVEGEYYCTDPAILIEEDGTTYVMGNINRTVVVGEASEEMAANGETATAVVHKLLRDGDGLFYVAETSYCPTTNGPEHYFSMFEGCSIRKDPDTGLYIMVYCNGEYTSKNGGTTSSGLAFAYATDPMGTWTYGDNGMNGADVYWGLPHKGGGNFGNVLYENGGRHEINPLTGQMIYHSYATYPEGNDHGGIVKANGQWYVFGHRQSGNGNGGRQNTIQKISLEYRADGSLVIPIAEMTSTGAADSISAYQDLDAGIACYLVSGYGAGAARLGPYVVNYLGNNDPDTNEGKNFDVTHYAPVAGLKDGSIAGYKYLDFAEGGKIFAAILVTGKENYADGAVRIWLDAPAAEAGGKLVGELTVSKQAMTDASFKEIGTDGTEWSWLTCKLSEGITGVHAVYYVFSSDTAGTDICQMDQISFTK